MATEGAERYGLGQIIEILPEDRTYGSLYRIDFGRFTLHLSDDEISRAPGLPG